MNLKGFRFNLNLLEIFWYPHSKRITYYSRCDAGPDFDPPPAMMKRKTVHLCILVLTHSNYMRPSRVLSRHMETLRCGQDVPEMLTDKIIIELDMGSLLSGRPSDKGTGCHRSAPEDASLERTAIRMSCVCRIQSKLNDGLAASHASPCVKPFPDTTPSHQVQSIVESLKSA